MTTLRGASVRTRKDGSNPRRHVSAARRIAGAALRRATAKVAGAPPAQPPVAAATAAPAAPPRRSADGSPPHVTAAREAFFISLEREGDLGLAAITVVRRYLDNGTVHRGRTLAQVLQQQDGRIREIGDICMGLLAAHSGLTEDAWHLFSAVDTGEILRFAPTEYFRVGFALDRDVAAKTLDAVMRGDWTVETDAAGWVDIAETSFAADALDLSRHALDRAESALEEVADPRRARALGTRIAWLRDWYPRKVAAAGPVPLPHGEVPIGVLGYRQPDRDQTSQDLGDYFESLATLAQLACRSNVHYTGDPELAGFAAMLRERIPAARAVEGENAAVRLYEVDRDATNYCAVPDGTWLVMTGLLPRSMFDAGVDLPLNPRLRPIFVSIHIDDTALLTPQVIDYLRRYAPIGCRDWGTVLLLQAAGVSAFFAGAVTTTLDTLATAQAAPTAGRLFVDVPVNGGGDAAPQVFGKVRTRSLRANLQDALQRVDEYSRHRRIVTSRLQTYLCARAIGTEVRFVPENPAQRCFDGLVGLGDPAVSLMRDELRSLLAGVFRAIVGGDAEHDVYALWSRLTASHVAAAEAQRRKLPELPPADFDVPAACATIRSAAVTIERSSPTLTDEEVNVEFSLDGNYKRQLEVVLDSIVTHASRPIRAFVLCREHTQADFERMAVLFPTVSFVWLPTDGVDYGSLRGLLTYTTVATMDRLLLPELLPEVTRIIHHDLDALCLTDLAMLFDVELGGTPIAGCRQPQLKTISGFAGFMRKSEKFTGNPQRGREFLRLSHARHTFDFDILNAGIMLLDLAVMRADKFCEEFLPYVERFGMNDQGVINAYVGGNRVEVDRGWNWRPWLGTIPEPKIAHWAGPFKPWHKNWVYGRDLWRAAEARVADRYQHAGL